MCIQDKEIRGAVVSRRNKTVRKAFVSYRPAVRRIYYDATNVMSGTEKPNYKG